MKSTIPWTARVLAPAVLLCAAGCARRGRPPVLSVIQSSDITTLDPNRDFEVVNDIVATNLFDPLLRFDQHMTLKPSLAVRWENPNDRTWRLHLRPGVRFQDGTLLSSDDVVFTVRRILADPDSEVFPFLAGIRRISAPDSETVEIETDQPTPLLTPLSFVYILPARRLAREGNAEFFRHPVGTGPYRFVGWKPGDRVDVEAWSGYWGGAPAVSRAAFRSIEKPEARWDFVERDHPTVLLEGPRLGWEQHLADRRLRMIARPGLSVSYLGLNVTPRPDNPLADRRVREAIRFAIDLKTLLREGADNHGFPVSQFVPPDVIGYNPAIPLPVADPGRARSLLAAAGHPDGIDLALDVQVETATTLLDSLVRQLASAGIRVTTKFWPKEEYLDRIDKGLSQSHLAAWVCTSGESAELFESSLHTRGPAGGLGRNNGTGYSNPQLDRLIEQIVATIDPGARVDAEKRAMAIAVADLPYVPLFIQEDRYVLTRDVAWEPRADGEIFLPEVRLQ